MNEKVKLEPREDLLNKIIDLLEKEDLDLLTTMETVAYVSLSIINSLKAEVEREENNEKD